MTWHAVLTQPHLFRILVGQQAIAWAIWWLAALLFVFFCYMLLGRALLFSSTMQHLFQHPNQSLFLGAVPMSVSTLTNGVVLFWIPR
jgi:tellurite resistance protein TehA-like permease